jgi:hypothetical protein
MARVQRHTLNDQGKEFAMPFNRNLGPQRCVARIGAGVPMIACGCVPLHAGPASAATCGTSAGKARRSTTSSRKRSSSCTGRSAP